MKKASCRFQRKFEKVIEERSSTEASRLNEAEAYRKIVRKITSERDEFAKRVYSQVLEFAICDGSMAFSYIADQVLPSALKEQKKARKELQPFALYEAIERILSQATYTENFGHSRRWPLYSSAYYSKTKRLRRPAGRLADEVLPENFRGSFYEFGVHHIKVGKAVEEIVRMIEKRYGISFAEIEKACKQGRS